MKGLSIFSRIVLALASLALLITYFVPVWRIDLFAPQYPEGLVMKIWLTRITDDVDIINGLNHYIGMKKISAEMFPEFSYLVYIVGAFIVYGLVVAISGSRKLLLSYLLVSLLGGMAALYDFYQWGYDYGHNLNPEAPIKVPGLAYQPPILGHKKLLNFDAYSLPDIGGWVVIVAVGLAFVVFFAESYAARKKSKSMTLQMAWLIILVSFFSCNAAPQPLQMGKDNCYTCKMTIVDIRNGGELVTTKGKVYKFDDLSCMLQLYQSHFISKEKIGHCLVVDAASNNLIAAANAWYVHAASIKTPMNGQTLAFSDETKAQQYATAVNGTLYKWQQLQNQKK